MESECGRTDDVPERVLPSSVAVEIAVLWRKKAGIQQVDLVRQPRTAWNVRRDRSGANEGTSACFAELREEDARGCTVLRVSVCEREVPTRTPDTVAGDRISSLRIRPRRSVGARAEVV